METYLSANVRKNAAEMIFLLSNPINFPNPFKSNIRSSCSSSGISVFLSKEKPIPIADIVHLPIPLYEGFC